MFSCPSDTLSCDVFPSGAALSSDPDPSPDPVSSPVPASSPGSVPSPVPASSPDPVPSSVPASSPDSLPSPVPASSPGSVPSPVPVSSPGSVPSSVPVSPSVSAPSSEAASPVCSSSPFISSVTVRISGKRISLSSAPTGRDCLATDSSRFAKAVITGVWVLPPSFQAAANTVKSTLVNTRTAVMANATPLAIFSLTFN